MFESVTIENFKSIKQINDLPIKPITVLCGINSCGKSTLLKDLLLLKQTVENATAKRGIVFNGDYVRLGDYSNFIYKHDKNNIFRSCYKLSLSQKQITDLIGRSGYRRLMSFAIGSYSMRDIDRINESFEISYDVSLESSVQQGKSNVAKSIVHQYKVSISVGKIDISVSFNHMGKEKYSIEYDGIMPFFMRAISRRERENIDPLRGEIKSVTVPFIGFLPDPSSLFQAFMETDKVDEGRNITEFVSVTNSMLQRITDKIGYIGPLREEPFRRYIYENVITDIGVKGENAPYIYANDYSQIVEKQWMYEGSDDGFHEVSGLSIGDSVNKWMNQMGIEKFNAVYDKEIIRMTLDDCNHSDTEVNIADVGFGISQIFPIILEGVRMPKDSLLLLEQPEIHLHPGLQTKMADFFIALAMSEKNVVVETHSDHIVNRLVRRIVEDETGEISKLVQIYFAIPSPDGVKYLPIEVDDTKGVVNWPEGFFDQYANEQELIIKAGLKKRKKLREMQKGSNQ